jgi:hypothetical protein
MASLESYALLYSPTVAMGGPAGAFVSKVTKLMTTESGPATCTFTCSGIPLLDVLAFVERMYS